MAPYKKPANAGPGLTVVLLAGALSITTLLAAMYLTKHSALLLASAPLLAPAAGKVDVGWHAPSKTRVNDLDSALDSEGVYGFIFDSSETPDEEYGTYNYCNMPHARKTEYVRPSSEYELQYVELVGTPSPSSTVQRNVKSDQRRSTATTSARPTPPTASPSSPTPGTATTRASTTTASPSPGATPRRRTGGGIPLT